VERASGDPLERDRQFAYLPAQRQALVNAGQPLIRVDTQKQELMGHFKNSGPAWGRAVPSGIYEPLRPQGTVSGGDAADTPPFAVDGLARRWKDTGQAAYPQAEHLLSLAEAGGSNRYRSRVFKPQLQAQLCDQLALAVTVCHYPPGCSKCNPIEHRLFSHLSLPWAGYPLRSWEVRLKYLRGTTTASGLQGQGALQPGEYPTGQRVSDAEMQSLSWERHAVCPAWNYTLRPRRDHFPEAGQASTDREVIH
jgi:hypothetical protein